MDKEILTLAETANYLKVSEKTVRRLIDDDAIPCAKVGGQWRFMKPMLQNWLQSQMKVVPQQAYMDTLMSQKEAISVSSLIDPSCIFWNMSPGPPGIILDTLSESLYKCGAVDNKGQFLIQLLEREEMMSTAIGKGLALPHPRISGRPPVLRSALAVGYCPEGIDFESIDGSKTHLFVVIASHTDPVHLRILSFFSKVGGQESFISDLSKLKNAKEFQSFLVEKETEILS